MWTPSEDKPVHKESEQGQSSKQGQSSMQTNEEIQVKKKVNSLEGAKRDKVRKPSNEHEVSKTQRRKISRPLVECKA